MRPEELGGVGAVGATAGGARYADGMVRNLDISASGGGLLATFEWDSSSESLHQFAAYLNGEPFAVVGPGEAVETGPVAADGQELEVVPFRLTEPSPGLDLSLVGRRPFLQWARSTASDVVAYRVYWDAGTGTVDTSAPYAVVSLVTADRLVAVSGGHAGRVTLGGNYAGPTINGAYTLTLTSATEWSVTVAGQTYSGRVIQGRTVNLFGGLTLTWLDAATAYQAGDSWTIRVGPRPYWIGRDEVPAGTYKFKVSAFDGANESALSAAATVHVASEPEPVESVAASWDPDTGTVTVTWSDVAGVALVRVYTNYNQPGDEMMEYVMEDGPIAEVVAPGDETASFTLGNARGEVLLYVRAVDSEGVEERNCSLIRLQCVAQPPAVLASPQIVEAGPAAGGAIAATWQISVEDRLPVALHFYVSDSLPDWGYVTEDSSVAYVDAGAYPIASGNWTSEGTYSGTVYVGVRAEDSDGNLTPRGELVAVETDGTAPDTPSLTPLWP
jgi:hypothetical protein